MSDRKPAGVAVVVGAAARVLGTDDVPRAVALVDGFDLLEPVERVDPPQPATTLAAATSTTTRPIPRIAGNVSADPTR